MYKKHKNQKDKSSKIVKCVKDKCEDEFKNKRNMKIHHKLKHGESIAKYPNQNNNVNKYNKNKEPCPDCSEKFINMGQHWRFSNCEYPSLSEYQKDLLRGIVMSDGSVQRTGDISNIKIKMTSKNFLEWFSNQLNIICSNRYPIISEKSDQAKKNAKNYFGKDVAEDSEYKDKYRIITRSHPFINNFNSWYPDKRYPLNDLELTPTFTKMWYCGDGCYDKNRNRVSISCVNEKDRINKVADLIREKGFKVNTTKNGKIRIPSQDSKEFLDWLGDPPPDFEYKWY